MGVVLGPGEQRGQRLWDSVSPNICLFPALSPQILQLSEFAPLLREIAPGPLNTPFVPGIIGPILGGGVLVDHIDGNLGPSGYLG